MATATVGTNGQVEQGLSDTFSNYHDYTVSSGLLIPSLNITYLCDVSQIDWQPKTLTFSIDGKVVRTIKQSDAMDPSGISRYPNTPSRIQLS